METQDILYGYAMSFVGLPYRWGGDDPIHGYDCSGLVIELLKGIGLLPPVFDTTAAGLYKLWSQRGLEEHPAFGTLAYFGSGKVTHIGFCLNDKLMLEAGGGGSKTLSAEDAAKQNAYVRIRPIRNRTDLVGFNRPNYPWK